MSKENDNTSIIPSWLRIKNTNLDLFYQCAENLNQFRKIPFDTDMGAMDREQKARFWVNFVSSLITLFQINRSLFKYNKNTEEFYDKLKILDNYQLKLEKLDYKKGIELFLIMEQALYKIGLLNIGVQNDDPTDIFNDQFG